MADAILHDCIVCGETFRHSKHKTNKFCCAACYHEAQRRGLVKPGRETKRIYSCHRCGKTVSNRGKARRRNGEQSDKVFCSRSCYDEHRREAWHAHDHPCMGCGKTIPGAGNGAKKKYCNMACKNRSKRRDPNTCLSCGSVFNGIVWRKLAHGHGYTLVKRGTCCRKCQMAWIRDNPERKRKIGVAFKGANHPNWQGGTHRLGFRGHDWQEIRESVIDRAGRRCEHCGMTEADHLERFRTGLNVNHKTPFHQFRKKADANKLSNLEALCKSCHTKEDWRWRKTHQVQMGMDLR